MNGTTSNNPLLPKELERKKRRILNLKVACCLLLSNTLTFMLVSPNKAPPKEATTRTGFSTIQWRLNNFTGGTGVTRATLLAGSRVLIPEIYLYNRGRDNGEQAGNYTLEVPSRQLPKLLRHRGDTLSAFPHAHYQNPTKKQGGPHEIRL